MVGIPGAGKSTAMDKLSAKFFVSSDWHIERLAKQRGQTYKEAFSDVVAEALSEMNRDVDFMLETNSSFIWDQTNLSVKKRATILKRIPKHYVRVAVFINTPLEVAIERNAKRSRTIPEGVIRTMASQLVPPSLEEGFNHIIEFDPYGRVNAYTTIGEDGDLKLYMINRGQFTLGENN